MINRKFKNGKPVIDKLIIHHTAGNPLIDKPVEKVRSDLSNIGYIRGYEKYNYSRETGIGDTGKCPLKHPETGKTVFPMYHYALQKYNGNYRLIQLVENPIKYDVGSTGKVGVNQGAISICVLGNFYGIAMSEDEKENIIQSLARKTVFLYYYNPDIEVLGHKDVESTGCPGELYSSLNRIKEIWKWM